MDSSSLLKGVFVFALCFFPSGASMAVTGTILDEAAARASKELSLTKAVSVAEADITLRRFKAAQLSDEEGAAFLKRVEKIREQLGAGNAEMRK